ncbi:Dual-specificity RNA methyltransferase RlmN [BD1-7 clade bacterium]|uniref:Dual-specificity RNA methyltransferase RlmN n=1 Tax=BD1-7 clade bacterium TaxID=2029982 RepID=A0A5S9PA96_9GAMM|nr:Dual-specificity RNA methyltransferase RlmN [BD1-7 clade bacterium]CAA0116120.1 Dual-specificity RNA methyltransferase RlmN [BD1-7 clade bacterium]
MVAEASPQRQAELAPYTDPDTGKVNLLGLSAERMEAFFAVLGEKRFRAQQVLKWIHHLGAEQIDDMTNISKKLRANLNEIAEIRAPEIVMQKDSSDGTRKFIMSVTGGSRIETVFIPDGDRGTLCVSSQVGCSLDCSFCSTGKQGFQRDLKVSEIIGQVWLAAKSYDSLMPGADRRVTNVVMMGMGEPLLNFDNVVDAMNLMRNDYGYGISKRRVTLSTSGVVPALAKLSSVTDVSLAISLHAPNDELRNELVPINRKYPIELLLATCRQYMDDLPDTHRVTTVEYTLIKGVNDSTAQAQELAILLKDFPCKINLIPFNPFSLSSYEKPGQNTIKRFQTTLMQAGFITTVRTTRGDDIDAACGQLVGQVADKTRRSARYQQKQIDESVVRIIK